MEFCPLFFLQIIGGICLFRFLYTQWRIFYVHFFPREFDFKGVAGDGYALITGGAEGIGKQAALHFAEKGINLILVDFNEKKLTETTKEISEKFSVSVIAKVMDLTTLADPAVYAAFEKEMLKKKIAILFNNAGIAGEKKSFWNFVNATHAGVCREVSINAEVVALMTKMVLPGMLERKKGVLMHMGSAGGLSPFDIDPVYSGTKSFVILFARSIRDQYPTSKTGIVHHVFYPAFIRTSLTTFISSGLKKNGYEKTLESLKNIIFPTVESWFKSAILTVGNGFDDGSGGCYFFEQFANYLHPHLDSETLRKISDLSE